MKKRVYCADCGCDRKIMVQAKVYFQAQSVTFSYRWLCFPCLLKVTDILDYDGKEYNRARAMMEAEYENKTS